jgi:hypothetical protein
MTVEQLIKKLQDLPPGLDVLIWDAGDRMGIVSVDDSFIDDGFIDLNTDTDE